MTARRRTRKGESATRPLLGVRNQPGRLAVAVFRVPLPLYRAGWGWLVGNTFLLLVHAGRRTGRPHSTVAMVLRHHADTGEAVICSVWGPNTVWVRNLRAHPALQVQIGRQSFTRAVAPRHRRRANPGGAQSVGMDHRPAVRAASTVSPAVASAACQPEHAAHRSSTRRAGPPAGSAHPSLLPASLAPPPPAEREAHDPTLDAAPAPAQGRRAVGRAVVGGLAALAVAPALTGTAEAAAEKRKPKPKRKWHRCKVHTKHTCWHARTCRHRKHKPVPPTDPPTDPGTPTSPGAYDEPAAANGLATLLALHLASRFTYGMTPALLQEMSGYPTVQAWLDAQLAPATISDPGGDALDAWWPRLAWDAPTMWAHEQAMTGEAWTAMADYQRWCLLRRMRSRRQLLESMTEFFENHLHVPVHDDGVFGFRADYGRTIRAHALGRFDQTCCIAAITHPAMRITSTTRTRRSTHPNENLGRELLELHTVGRGQLHRGRRQGRPRGSSPATTSTCGRPGRRRTTRRRTGPARSRSWGSATRTPTPTAAPVVAALPHLPRAPPGHRRTGSPASWRSAKFVATTPRRRSSTTWPRSTCQRHRHRAGAAGPGRPTGVRRRPPGPRSATPARTWSPPAGRSTSRPRRPPATARSRQRGAVAEVGHGPGAVRLAPARRAADRQRLVVLALAGAGLVRDPLHDVRRLVADAQIDLPPRRVVGAARAGRRSASTPSSTTCPRAFLRRTRDRPGCSRRAAWPPGSPRRARSPATTPLVKWGMPRPAHHLARLPRPPDPVSTE